MWGLNSATAHVNMAMVTSATSNLVGTWHSSELPVHTFWHSINNVSGLNIPCETPVQFTALFIDMTG